MEAVFIDNWVGSWGVDIFTCWWVILICFGSAILFTLIYIKLMHWFAMPLAWASVVLIQVGLIYSGFYFYN